MLLYHDAGLAWLHFIFAFVLVGALVAELFILRLRVDGAVARLLLRVDLFYGVAAVLIILAGVARLLWGAKNWDFYQAQPFFWAKMAILLVIGALSIVPTRTFMRWKRAADADAAFAAPEAEVKLTRSLVMWETHLLALLLLFASFMARAIGS